MIKIIIVVCIVFILLFFGAVAMASAKGSQVGLPSRFYGSGKDKKRDIP